MSAAATQTSVRCTRCGEWIEAGFRFCTNCGAPVAMPSESGPALAVADEPVSAHAEPPVLSRARRDLPKATSTRAAWYGLGLASAQAGDWPDAYRYLDRALKDADGQPSDERVHALLAIAAREAGKPVEAARNVLFAVARSERPSRADVMAAVTATASLADPSVLRPVARSLLRIPGAGEALACVALALCGATEEAQNAGRKASTTAPQALRWGLEAAIPRRSPDDPSAENHLSNEVLVSLAEIAQQLDATSLSRRAANRVLALEGQDYGVIGRAHAVLARTTKSSAPRAHHFFEAGRNALWADDHEAAVPLLRAAVEAQPRKEAYWFLAESVRRLASPPEPFMIDAAGLADAKASWEAGFSLGAPDQGYAWAYYVPALIEISMADLEDDDRLADSRCWEAIRWTVAGMVLGPDPWDIWGWTTLSQRLRAIDARGAAAMATSSLLAIIGPASEFEAKYGSGETPADTALQEAMTSAFYLHPPQAAGLIAQGKSRQAQAGSEAWNSMLESWDQMRSGAPKAGLASIQHAVDVGGTGPYFTYGLARALLVDGEQENGRKEAERLCKALSPVPEMKRGWVAWSALWAWGAVWCGRAQQAERLMAQCADLVQPGCGRRVDAMLVLAVCALQRGDIDRAQSQLDEMLGDNPNAGTLLDAQIDLEFGLTADASDDVRDFVKRAKRRFRGAYQRALKSWDVKPEAALDELSAMVPDSQPESLEACQAVSVLLLGSAGRWRQAAMVASGLATPGVERLSGELLRFSRTNLAGELLSDLEGADPESAQSLIASFLDAGLKSPTKLAADWRARLDVSGYWHLHDLASAIPRGRERRLLGTTLTHLDGWLDERFGSSVPSSLTSAATPNPIALELGAALIPPDAVEKWMEWELFADLIPSMKIAIETTTGVSVPGVHVSGNEALADGEYVILLSGSPFDGGSVPFDRRWVQTALETVGGSLSEDGSSSEPVTDERPAVLEQRHPLTGRLGTWTDAPARRSEAVDPLRFIMAHVEAVLRSELHRFVMVDDVRRLVESWVTAGAAPELGVLAATPDGLRWLTCVLRRLTMDGVALRPESVSAGLGQYPSGDAEFAVRAIRQHIREELPGNDAATQSLKVPEPLQAMSIQGDGSRSYTPAAAWELVSDVVQRRSELGDSFALVASEPGVAHAIRRLLQDEVGNIAVLAAEEAVDG